MPTHKTRYEGKGFSSNGQYYHFRIYDKNYTSSTVIPVTVGGGGIKIDYDTSGQEKFSPIIASKCSISLVVENSVFGTHFENFILRLRDTYEEGDATIAIWGTGGYGGSPLWSGNLMIDLSSKEDVSKPYEIELNATDGIGLLKSFDMVSVQGSSPYASADTYISNGYQTFIYWLTTILEYCNTPDGDSTDGDVSDYTFSTSVDWWYDEHPAADPAISPLAYTQCQMLGGYTATADGTYKVKSVYQVLESMCKMWGMRVVFWRNRFYFTQVELYKTAETGTFSVPDNIDSQIWRRNGSLQSSQSYIGEPNYTAYNQEIETNAGGFDGGLQKLAGSKWDYYPKLKQVSVEFESISNNNFFTTFPQPAVQNNTYPNYDIDQITSSSLGTITGASAFAGFNLVVSLEYNNASGINNMNCCTNFSVRARPSGDTDWNNGYVFWNNAGTYSWITHPQEGGAVAANEVWYEFFEDIQAGFGGVFFNLMLNPTILTLPPGTSQHTIFSGVLPQNTNFTGDWEFEIFTIAYNQNFGGLGGQQNWNGHHGEGAYGPPYQTFPPVNLTTVGVTYNDLLDSNGNPVSQFNPVYTNSTIGGGSQTSVFSARSETQHEIVKDLWWGDTPTDGQPSSLIWDDGAGNTGFTDPDGKWRNGQSGTFNKVLAEVLGEARIFNQQTSDYKWSLGTAVSSINSWKSDASGARPVYINPVGRINDTVDGIFYYFFRGKFNILLDQWEGEWLQVSYTDSITTTTTTTSTGGTAPDDNYAAARLGSPSSARAFQPLRIGSLTADLKEATSITSISIAKMNTDLFGGGDPIFEQNTLIKEGDVFNIESNTTFQQFTASADVGNTDTTISTASTTVLFPFPKGSTININIRDTYQQGNHKTRGTIHIPQYSLSESSADPSDPAEGNAVIWMSDGTASGNDGDIIAKIQAGGVIKRFNMVDFASFTNTYSIDFGGVDDYIDVSGSASAIDEDLGSVSFWINLDSVSGSVTSFQAAVDTSNFIRVWYKDSDSTLRFQTKRGGTNNVTYYAGGVEADGWHHLAMTWDSSANELKGYLDGVARGGTGTAAGSWSGSLSIVHIGKQATASASYWKGNIDEVGIWDSVLTAAEITEIYNSGNPLSLLKDAGDYSSSADLIGWWRMGDSATYPTIPDDSTNSNNGTMTNMTADLIVQDIPE